MRLTYTDIQAQFLRNTSNAGITSATQPNLIADFNANLGQRYQLALAKLQNYNSEKPYSFNTVAGQQYYPYPPGIQSTDTLQVTIGNVSYPLDTIYSQATWNVLNSIQLQPTAIPQFIFPRSAQTDSQSGGGGFGIWPIPQAVYPCVLNYYIRDRNLIVPDYTTGSLSVTNGSATVTGSGTTFTAAMVGKWLTVTDTSNTGYGYWYLISAYTSATSITVFETYGGATGSALTYRIGDSPILPEEGHTTLADGVTADFYAGMRKDPDSAEYFNNKFWTGDGFNKSRDEGDNNIGGGLINLINVYGGRDDKRIIKAQPRVSPAQWKIWAISISG